ncbi:hypothetical protein [Streptomyces griseofuscus]|uniref:hypothetical protein n=1 Tax=Streptomyces griseofuscus TaxID=146922 RepID=UPI003453A06E
MPYAVQGADSVTVGLLTGPAPRRLGRPAVRGGGHSPDRARGDRAGRPVRPGGARALAGVGAAPVEPAGPGLLLPCYDLAMVASAVPLVQRAASASRTAARSPSDANPA